MRSALDNPAPFFTNPARDDSGAFAVDVLSGDALTANVLSVFHRIPAEILTEGVTWYRRESAEIAAQAAEIAAGFSVALADARRALVYAVAVVSPKTTWEQNVPLGVAVVSAVLRSAPLDGIGATGRDKAAEIAGAVFAGKTDAEIRAGFFATSPKTWAFLTCLVNPAHPDAVCIDGHAYNLATFVVQPITKTPTLTARGRYAKLANAYRRAASAVGLLPLEMQAATWHAWRASLKGRGENRRAVGFTSPE